MQEIADIIFKALLKAFVFPEIVVALVSIIPIVEARLAVPIALRYGISPLPAWLLSFCGSIVVAPLLLLLLIPFVKWLSTTKIFRRVGETIYEKFEKKSDGIDKNTSDFKKALGVFLFVAIPLPLTGVWTGSAVASIIGLKLPKAAIAVVLGNLIASGIVTLLCVCFEAYIDYIILVLTVIAVAIVAALIVKIILHSPSEKADGEGKKE